MRQYRAGRDAVDWAWSTSGTAFAAALPPRTWPCWPKWMRCIVRVWASAQEVDGTGLPGVQGWPASSGWRGFQSPTCTTCGAEPYQRTRRRWTKTRPTGVPIGQRRAPQPNGLPGYMRIDSVHQGDQDGMKGVYHINAVDSVTQFQLVATCEKISEAICCRSSDSCWRDFRLSSWDSRRITARSTSIIKSRRCWRSCASSSPVPPPAVQR